MASIDELEKLKAERAELDSRIQEAIHETLPEILRQVLKWVEVLNQYNKGDKYSLKRGIYNVTEDNMDRPFSASNPTETPAAPRHNG